MRCQKVRSFLSAYCKGELTEKRTSAIAAHLEGCPRCRYEEAAYRDMNKSMGELQNYAVSENFNSLLLKRVADERFRETRTKAFMPKKIPVFTLNRLAPVIAAACFVFAFIFSGGMDLFIDNPDMPAYVSTETGLDDSYMTVQPRVEFNETRPNWAFEKEVARATRINGLMNQLSYQGSFGSLASSSRGNRNWNPIWDLRFPRVIHQFPQTTTNTNERDTISR